MLLEDVARDQHAAEQREERAGIERHDDIGVEGAVEIGGQHRLAEQARCRKVVDEGDQRLGPLGRKQPQPDGEIPHADDGENRYDDIEDVEHGALQGGNRSGFGGARSSDGQAPKRINMAPASCAASSRTITNLSGERPAICLNATISPTSSSSAVASTAAASRATRSAAAIRYFWPRWATWPRARPQPRPS